MEYILKKEVKCNNEIQSNRAKVFTQIRAHAMGTGTTQGRLLVQRMWTDSSKHGMKHIKSQFKKTKKEKKNAPLL